MALKSIIYKASINISDVNRHVYQDVNLRLARHPSETEERMMMRLLAFIANFSTSLSFAKGLSCDDEPDVWQKGLSGDIELWIDVGLPSFDRLRKASHRTSCHKLYVYGEEKNVKPWWSKVSVDVSRLTKLEVFRIDPKHSHALANLASSHMNIQVLIDDNEMFWSVEEGSLNITLTAIKTADNST